MPIKKFSPKTEELLSHTNEKYLARRFEKNKTDIEDHMASALSAGITSYIMIGLICATLHQDISILFSALTLVSAFTSGVFIKKAKAASQNNIDITQSVGKERLQELIAENNDGHRDDLRLS